MKAKLFLPVFFIAMIFYSCSEEPSLPKPKEEGEKNVTVKLENIPEKAKGKDGVLFIEKGDELYLTQTFFLEDDNEVKVYLPEKETYNISAFIKKENKDWSPDDEEQEGWYSSINNQFVSAENPQLFFMTDSWDPSEDQGDIIKLITCEIIEPTISTSPYEPNKIISVEIDGIDNSQSNISKVTLYMDGNEIKTMTEPGYYHDINTKDFEAGKHELKAEAENTEGFTATDQVDIYIAEKALGEAPKIENFNMDTEIVQGDSVTISANIYDPDGEIEKAELFIDDSKFSFTDTSGTNFIRGWHTSSVGLGLHEIKITATDNDDNKRTKRQNVTIIE